MAKKSSSKKDDAKENTEEHTDYVLNHSISPGYEILSPEHVSQLLTHLNCTKDHLPRIKKDDVAVKTVKGNVGDVIKIIRHDLTSENYYYRVIVK